MSECHRCNIVIHTEYYEYSCMALSCVLLAVPQHICIHNDLCKCLV